MNKPTGALRTDASGAVYQVRIAPVPTVIDAVGSPVDHAQVLEIASPGDTVDTPIGRANVIVGAGVAKIIVGDMTVRGVPLC